jgi:hypothetical protein
LGDGCRVIGVQARIRRCAAIAGQPSRAGALVAAAVLALVLSAPALADGDPASDYLLSRSAFVPPDAGVSSASAARLVQTLADAKAKGYVIRVALIGSRYDMGSVTALWRQPKLYARFLGMELRFIYKKRLLVVMPNGYGTSQAGQATPSEQAIADGFKPPARTSDSADAAVRVVVALAAKQGVVVQPPAPVAPSRSSTTRDRIVIAVAAVIVALLAVAVWQRKRLLPQRRHV